MQGFMRQHKLSTWYVARVAWHPERWDEERFHHQLIAGSDVGAGNNGMGRTAAMGYEKFIYSWLGLGF